MGVLMTGMDRATCRPDEGAPSGPQSLIQHGRQRVTRQGGRGREASSLQLALPQRAVSRRSGEWQSGSMMTGR